MDGDAPAATTQNPNGESDVLTTTKNSAQELKTKVVVIMGATGAGKSKLAVDLAAHFPIEIINADSMQVYRGLDVITNKVPVDEQKGVPHHLLGTVNPNVEFTAKEFRDSALPIINGIRSRNCVPVVVGGTNYYIQALVSSFLLDETAEDDVPEDEETNHLLTESDGESFRCDYEHLRAVDPVAADRIHPNNYRKINQYLNLYARSGQNWGRVDTCRFDCCFICVDASVSVLDHYVNQRVDCMIDAGLLDEVYEIYNTEADYTRGLRQAIGVREFEDFLRVYLSEPLDTKVINTVDQSSSIKNTGKDKLMEILQSPDDNSLKVLLTEAIAKVKMNTRRLLWEEALGSSEGKGKLWETTLFRRRWRFFLHGFLLRFFLLGVAAFPQAESEIDNSRKRMKTFAGSSNYAPSSSSATSAADSIRAVCNVTRYPNPWFTPIFSAMGPNPASDPESILKKRMHSRLEKLFGWNIHYVDATEAISSRLNESWDTQVLEPAVRIITSFLHEVHDSECAMDAATKATERDLWTKYTCKACGDKVLRGAHEWEQHKQGRGHRKRICKLRKSLNDTVSRTSMQQVGSTEP
ncbi:tRNA dimethylallyltransferase 2 [Linum perenne]